MQQALFEQVISSQAAAGPERPAVVSQGRACSYGLMEADIRRCIGRLADEGLPAGARVLIDTPDLYMFWALAFACESLGLSFCAAPPGGLPEGLSLLLAPALRLTTATSETPGVRTVRIDGAFVADLSARSAVPTPDRPRSEVDEVCVLLSSGTTGEPKALAVSRGMLAVRSRHFVDLIAREAQIAPRGLALIGPWSIAGVQAAFYVWFCGGCLCSADGVGGWADRLRAADPDIIQLAPLHLQQLLADMGGWRPSRECRVFVVGGTPSAALVEQARAKLTPDVWVTYGATEAGVVASAHIDELAEDREVAGRIHSWTTAEVLDDDGASVAPGGVGALRVRVEGMAHGYLGGPPDAPGSPFRDGWFRPGDLASIDADRVLRIHGREDDLLHLGGAKILPSALERVLEPLAGVRECAAFAVPDADGLDIPAVAVACDEGFEPGPATQVLWEVLRRPVRLIKVDVLPRNAMGKVDRVRLRGALSERALARGLAASEPD